MHAAYSEFALTTGADENSKSKEKPLKRLAILGLVITLSVLFTAECSKTQTTKLLAEQWETGQHRSCLYGHKNLYCFPADFLEKLPEEQRKQVTPYFMETKREKLLEDKRSDGGSYETKFTSHTPMDFSVWDCYKTGTGSPAIACDLKQKPTKDEVSAFVKTETEQEEHNRLEQAASDYLVELQPNILVEACGQGTKSQSGSDLSSYEYPFAEFKFRYLGMYDQSKPGRPCGGVSDSCGPRYFDLHVSAKSPKPNFWDIELQVKYHNAALDVVQDIPCLLEKVRLRSNQHLEIDRAASADGTLIPEF